MEDDANPKFFGESMLLQSDRLSRIWWGCAAVLVTWFRARDSIVL